MEKLFDENTLLSAEVEAMLAIAARLSECEGFHRLTQSKSVYEARRRVIVGPFESTPELQGDADGDGRIGIDDLALMNAYAQILPSVDEAHVTQEPDAVASCPDEGGTIELKLYRQIREVEQNTGGLQDAYLFVLDCVGGIQFELHQRSHKEGQPRINSIRRPHGPTFNSVSSESAQGVHSDTILAIEWGFLGAE